MTDLDRRYLLTLLLRSLLDAQPGLHRSGEAVGGRSKPGSREPRHMGESRMLWRQGSYPELDKWLRRMADEDGGMHHAVHVCYIHQPPRRPRSVAYHEEYKERYADRAEAGLSWLMRRMPGRIRVPLTVVENSGHVRRPHG